VALGGGPTGVVLAHQAASDLCEWLPRARVLAAEGRQVLAFDCGQAGQLEQDMVAATARTTPPVAGVDAVSSPEDFQGVDAAAAAPASRPSSTGSGRPPSTTAADRPASPW
jgi:hypothetical protein